MSYYDYRTSAERARNGASFDAQRDDYEGYHSVNQLSDACAETTGVFAAAAGRSAEAFGAALVCAMGRDVAYQSVPFQKIVVLATAVPCIGQHVAP